MPGPRTAPAGFCRCRFRPAGASKRQKLLNSSIRELFPFRFCEIETASMTGGEGFRANRDLLQANQAAARWAAIVEQDSMDIAHHQEFQPPAASKIRVAVREASRAKGNYIIVSVVTA
jgi:hypothetical protein